MKRTPTGLALILNALVLTGIVACGGAGSGPDDSGGVEALSIANCPSAPLRPGDRLALRTEGTKALAKNAAVVSDYRSDRPRIVAADAQGQLTALYPGEAEVTASAVGTAGDTCKLEVLPPEHQALRRRLTDNTDEDHWGANNSWKMTARGRVLWQRVDGNLDTHILLHDRQDAPGTDATIDVVDFLTGGVDFMALGSGAQPDSVLASYRIDLARTQVSANGNAPTDLGDRQQEENSIAEGCFLFREGGGENDIQNFQVGAGVQELFSAGDTYTPIGSECRAVWENRLAADSELVYFDGTATLKIADGLPAFPDFDFRRQRAVYAQGGDIYLVDLTVNPPRTIRITDDGLAKLDRSPRSDGEAVYWHQIDGTDEHIWRYDIAADRSDLLSTTNLPKKIDSLQADLGQALWVECSSLPCSNANASLWFHPGDAPADSVALGGVPLDLSYRPTLADGLAAWVGNDGDTEIFTLE